MTDGGARLIDCWVENAEGERVTSLEHGEPIRLRAELEVLQPASGLMVGFVIANADGLGLFEFGSGVEAEDGSNDLTAGQTVKIEAQLQNPLAEGRHFINCGIQSSQGGISFYLERVLDFVVFGGPAGRGLVALDHEIEARLDDGGAG